jgi:tetratricopeptide (TPR) repeat protein
VEKLFGARKFLAIYILSAFGAALISLTFNPMAVSAGASGAIFGLFGALTSYLWKHHADFPPNFLKFHKKILAIFILYGIAYGAIMQGVDNAAHIGGLLVGCVAGFVLLPRMPGEITWRRRDSFATVFVVTALLGLLSADRRMIAANISVIGDAAYQKAVSLLQKRKWTEALPLLDAAISDMPDVPEVRLDRARAYQQLGEADKALSDCDKALQIDPKNKVVHMVRASALHDLKHDDDSVNELTLVIKADPKNAMAYNNRAWSLASKASFAAAIEDSNRAIKLDRMSSTFYDTRAMAFFMSGHSPEALADLDRGMTLKPDDAACHYHLACVFTKAGDKVRAEANLRRAKLLGYKPESWEPQLTLN